MEDLQEAYGEAQLELRARKIGVPVGHGRVVIDAIRQELRDNGFEVSVSRSCAWLGFARRTVYYTSTKTPPAINETLAEPIKATAERDGIAPK